MQAFNDGLFKNCDSIDAIAILQITTEVPNGVSGDSQIAKDCYELVTYLVNCQTQMRLLSLLSYEHDMLYFEMVVVLEYKHKLKAGTIQKLWNIVRNVLNGGMTKVIGLGTSAGDTIVCRAITNVDYRCHFFHEAYVCCISVVVELHWLQLTLLLSL